MPDTTVTDPKPLLERARGAMRGLTETEAALKEVGERLRVARGAARPELDDVVAAALAGALAGEPPDDAGDRVLATRRANEAAMAAAQVWGAVERRLQERRWSLHRDGADHALRVLSAELDTLLAEAAPALTALGSAGSAEQAISADRVEEWRNVNRLAERYTELRSAQAVIVSAAVTPAEPPRVAGVARGEARELVLDYGHVREPDRHYPEVGNSAATRSDPQLGATRIINGRVVESTHTERPVRTRPWATGDPLADLRFIVREDVQAWVPSIRNLTGARTEYQERQRDAEQDAEPQPTRAIGRSPSRPPVAFLSSDH